jgi:hypothetical protein
LWRDRDSLHPQRLRKRIAAHTSLKRYVRHTLGFKAQRGWGWLTNPRRAAYNRLYNRTTVGCAVMVVGVAMFAGVVVASAAWLIL